jgi:hypothetical protein
LRETAVGTRFTRRSDGTEWKIVDGGKVESGKFFIDIVVTEAHHESAKSLVKGQDVVFNSNVVAYGAIAAVFAAGLIYFISQRRK